MQFKTKKKVNPNVGKYEKEILDISYEFTKKLYKEFGTFLKAVVLFGSGARKLEQNKMRGKLGDIDILVIVDDTSVYLGKDVVEAYRIVTEKTIREVSTRIHVTSLKFTSFWEYIRAGDPIGINILRDGVPLIDTGFFTPLQVLLYQGRIRPTYESIWTYFERAPKTLYNSKLHMLQATLDLYWAVIDAAHASLMKLGEIPPSPDHVADLIEKKMVKEKHLDRKYAKTMRKFYNLSRAIMHREKHEVTAKEFDSLYKEAEDFVNTMKQFLKGKGKK